VRSGALPDGHFRTIVDAIAPAVTAEANIDDIVRANAKLVGRAAIVRSDIVREAVTAGRLRVTAARYAMDSGRVTLLAD